jgi:nucleoid DNA-binding protein
MPRHPGKAKLTKLELASDLCDLLHLSRGPHGRCDPGVKIVDAILHVIIKALRREEQVYVRGLGRFKVITPRRGGNIRPCLVVEKKFNGKRSPVAINAPPRKKVIFIPDHQIRKALRDPV